jgi:Mitochondrial mRNA-processing protein COX24, C-terminal
MPGNATSQRYAVALACARPPMWRACNADMPAWQEATEGGLVGSVIKKRRKRMAKKKHRKLLRKTRVQRRNKK